MKNSTLNRSKSGHGSRLNGSVDRRGAAGLRRRLLGHLGRVRGHVLVHRAEVQLAVHHVPHLWQQQTSAQGPASQHGSHHGLPSRKHARPRTSLHVLRMNSWWCEMTTTPPDQRLTASASAPSALRSR